MTWRDVEMTQIDVFALGQVLWVRLQCGRVRITKTIESINIRVEEM